MILETAEILDGLITSNGTDTQGNDEKVQVLRKRYDALLGEQSTTLISLDEEIDADIDANEELEACGNWRRCWRTDEPKRTHNGPIAVI